MVNEEQREKSIQGIANLLRISDFKVEFRVKKKPQGIKVIIDVTQEQMENLARQLISGTHKVGITQKQ